jgi:hypothetical protein
VQCWKKDPFLNKKYRLCVVEISHLSANIGDDLRTPGPHGNAVYSLSNSLMARDTISVGSDNPQSSVFQIWYPKPPAPSPATKPSQHIDNTNKSDANGTQPLRKPQSYPPSPTENGDNIVSAPSAEH